MISLEPRRDEWKAAWIFSTVLCPARLEESPRRRRPTAVAVDTASEVCRTMLHTGRRVYIVYTDSTWVSWLSAWWWHCFPFCCCFHAMSLVAQGMTYNIWWRHFVFCGWKYSRIVFCVLQCRPIMLWCGYFRIPIFQIVSRFWFCWPLAYNMYWSNNWCSVWYSQATATIMSRSQMVGKLECLNRKDHTLPACMDCRQSLHRWSVLSHDAMSASIVRCHGLMPWLSTSGLHNIWRYW